MFPTSKLLRQLVFQEHGNPKAVLKIIKQSLPDLSPTQIHLKFLASPINPADINQIQGTYPISIPKTDQVYIPGNEGVAKILNIGSKVSGLKIGDWVLPFTKSLGTWRMEAICEPSNVMKIDAYGVSPLIAATASVNPCTALLMLKIFVNLKPGDVVIQNGANSSVGQAVIQIARKRGIKTINVIRDRYIILI